MRLTLPSVLLLLLLLAGCDAPGGDAHAAAVDEPAVLRSDPAARDVRDRQLDSALAAFRAPLAAVSSLGGGARSRDALAARFVAALASADTGDLRAMTVSRAEFAWLVYPGSAYTRRPSRQEAELVWFLQLQASQKGLSRALARYGGEPLALLDYRCAPEPVREGANALWHDCVLRLRRDGAIEERRLFGAVLERDGHFKLHSFANDL